MGVYIKDQTQGRIFHSPVNTQLPVEATANCILNRVKQAAVDMHMRKDKLSTTKKKFFFRLQQTYERKNTKISKPTTYHTKQTT